MKKLLYILIIPFLFSSCETINPEEDIPAYIHIDSIQVNLPKNSKLTNSSNISDAWIYIDGKIIGAFEMPCTIPVLSKGLHEITILPGIRVNGFNDLRAYYPFLKQYSQKINLTPYTPNKTITTLNPTIDYFDDINLAMEEPFISENTVFEAMQDNKAKLMVTNKKPNNDYYGSVNLNSTENIFSYQTSSAFKLPTNGLPSYLELDYNTNTEFTVGFIIKYPNNPSYKYPIIHIYESKGIWKKIYINLTDILQRYSDASEFQLFLESKLPIDKKDAFLNFDNIRLIH